MPLIIEVPNVSFTLISTAVFGVLPGDLEDLLVQRQRAGDQHRRRREVAHDELVALLGDLRRRRDVDHQRHAALLGRPGRWRWSGRNRRRRPACGSRRRSPSRPGCARRRAWSRCRSSRSRASPAASCRRTRRWRHRRRGGRPGRSAPARPEVGSSRPTLRLAGPPWAKASRSGRGAPSEGGAGHSRLSEAAAGDGVAAGHCGSSQWILLGRTIETVLWGMLGRRDDPCARRPQLARPLRTSTAAVGDTFELAPWVAERGRRQRPFATVTALH